MSEPSPKELNESNACRKNLGEESSFLRLFYQSKNNNQQKNNGILLKDVFSS